MFNIKIQRDSNNVSWGFRMQGGRDYGSPLQIQSVNPNSLSEQSGMQSNDYILRIGQISTEFLQHKEAQEQIKRQNNFLDLTLQRGSSPTSADYNNQVDFSAYPPTLVPQPSPQIVVPISDSKVVSSQAYNTPIGLYSADNINDTLARTLKSINMSSNQKIQQPIHSNEFQPTPAKSMPKPAPVRNSSQPSQPIPFNPPVIKPTTNSNKPGGSNLGNRTIKKGKASFNQNENANQIAQCYTCGVHIRGPFISAIGHCYCVNHFTCTNCSINLVDCGFVEENGKLYCEKDFEQFLAPHCAKCSETILKECVHALEKTWHPQCFLCTACKKSIGSGSFHVEEGQPYCTEDFRRMFQSKCASCEFPIEPGDRYLEALGGIYHAECFCCSACQTSLDGQGFVVKNNRPYCPQHGRQKFSS